MQTIHIDMFVCLLTLGIYPTSFSVSSAHRGEELAVSQGHQPHL